MNTNRINSCFSALWGVMIFVTIVLGSSWIQGPTYGQISDEAPDLAETVDGVTATVREDRSNGFVEFVGGLEASLDMAFSGVVGFLVKILFFSILGPNHPFPFIVAVLVVGSIFFTFWHGFINVRGLRHSFDLIRGRYDNPKELGEVTHFRALTSALSATVGLGNIAGVAIAISLGGSGAVFWMLFLAVFGMTAKFHECTLAQLYRRFNEDGSVSGGPMYYLDLGLKRLNPSLAPLGKVLAIVFAIMCIGGSLGGGNMFQANQAFTAFNATFLEEHAADGSVDKPQTPEEVDQAEQRRLYHSGVFGIVMAGLVGVVILGGIRRIGAATSRIVPAMCGIYVVASLVIIIANVEMLPSVIQDIFVNAFRPDAAFGGFVGVMVQGFKRAAFSNEAGLGSAAIPHSAAKTDEPVREGIVAMVGPFLDTIIVCFMTSLVILITKANHEEGLEGAAITAHAFASLSSWFPAVLTVCIVLFAYSTMISWCYYGERAWSYLLGWRSLFVFRLIFVLFVFFGSIMNLGSVLDFSDLMILCMAFPNIIGGVILAPVVKRHLIDYWRRYKSGEMKPTE